MGPTAKTMVVVTASLNQKMKRTFFFMERAQGLVGGPCGFYVDVVAEELDQVDLLLNGSSDSLV